MAYEKTWQFMANEAFTPASAIDNARRTLWSLKAFLKGELGGAVGAGVLWTHFGSCNGDGTLGGLSECGSGGADQWTAAYDGSLLVRAPAASNHSWIVLKSPVGAFGGETFYLIIDYGTASDQQANFVLCKSVPSVGTRTARPTGTDEWPVNGRTNGLCSLSDGSTSVHRIMAGINENGGFYYTINKNGAGFSYFGVIIDDLAEPQAGDTYNIWSFMAYNNTTPGALEDLSVGQSYSTSTTQGSNNMKLSSGLGSYPAPPVLPGVSRAGSFYKILYANAGGSGVNSLTGKALEWPLHVIQMDQVSSSSPTIYHYRGRLVDLAWGGGVAQGSVIPASGPPEYFMQGSLWLPGTTAPTL